MSVPGDQIFIKLELPLVAYPGDQVPIQVPPEEVEPPVPVTRYTQASWLIPWTELYSRTIEQLLPWQVSQRRQKLTVLRSGTGTPVRRDFLLAWNISQNLRFEAQLGWGTPTRAAQSVSLLWKTIPRVLTSDVRISWRKLSLRARSASIAWRAPPRVRGEAWIRSDLAGRHIGIASTMGWNRLRPEPIRTEIPWGQARRVPWIPGSPGFFPPPPPNPPGYVAPPGDRVYLRLVCPLYDYPGDQVPLRLGPSQCYYDFAGRRTYIVENIVEVVRLPERTPIEFSSMGLSTSINSLYWDFRGQLADPSQLGYLEKDVSGSKELEITINGHVWRILVEDHDDNRQFLPRTVSVQGRSRTCVLSEPFAAPKSRVETATRTAQQLMEFEVDSTGFSIDHFEQDWVVPGNTWTYQGLTPIEAIKEVAAASGSVVMSHAWDSKLLVYPRYPVSPWNWTTTDPDNVIYDATCARIQTKNKSLPLYDYILVSGETVGVADPVIRDGSSGEVRAEMVVHRLIVTHPAALERGRNELGNRGEQKEVTMQIPLFPDGDECGLVMPMQLVQVETTPSSWKGLVISTNIEVSADDDGTLTIWQNPMVERHLTDAN